jgi:hypothetical protein
VRPRQTQLLLGLGWNGVTRSRITGEARGRMICEGDDSAPLDRLDPRSQRVPQREQKESPGVDEPRLTLETRHSKLPVNP